MAERCKSETGGKSLEAMPLPQLQRKVSFLAQTIMCVCFGVFFSFSASQVSGRVLLNGRLYVAGLFPWWPAMWENNSEVTKNPAFN